MATYKEIKGVTIQTLSEDPVLAGAAGGSWSSGGNLNEGIVGNAGFGTYTAAVSVGGFQPPYTAQVEEYNGSSWTTVTSTPTAADSMGSCGPQTAGLVFGGQGAPGGNINSTFEYDATNWTSGGNLNTTRRDLIGAGTQTAGLAAFGAVDPPFSAEAEQYNGSAWTTVAEGNTARRSAAGGGTSTSAMAYGGFSPPYTSNAETWNGTSWTEVANIHAIKGILGGGGASNTSQLAFGGYGGPPGSQRYTNTESWNGASWTEVNDLSVARSTKHGLPSSPTANQLFAGGHTPPANYTTITEEWSTTPASEFSKTVEGQLYFNSTTNTFKETITDIAGATWATGGSMNVSSHARNGAGHLNTAALAIGADPSPQGQTELYNGTSWTELNDLNVGRRYAATLGTTTLALAAGGANPGGYSNKAETWDGSSWTAISDINSTRGYFSGAGVYNSGIIIGGEPDSLDTRVETWDGSSWTEVSEVNTGVRQFARAGHSSANDALKAGGYTGTAHTADTETWNGSSWTEVGNLNTSRYSLAGDGASSASALAFGGYTSTNVANTESWNGSSWTEVNDLGTARNNLGGAGISASALAFGANPASAATEEFTADNALATVTVS